MDRESNLHKVFQGQEFLIMREDISDSRTFNARKLIRIGMKKHDIYTLKFDCVYIYVKNRNGHVPEHPTTSTLIVRLKDKSQIISCPTLVY